MLYGGLPVRDAYICDINGDGSPDFCSTINIGSGIVDSRVIICDYANGKIYVIEDRVRPITCSERIMRVCCVWTGSIITA